jgi:hypothetical protein
MLSPHATYTQPFAEVHTITIPSHVHGLGMTGFTVEVSLRSLLPGTRGLTPYPFPWWDAVAPNGDVTVHLMSNRHSGVVILRPLDPSPR